MIYTHENRFFVYNAKNILEAEGIPVFIKNEYAAGAAGDLSPFDTWLELWLLDDDHCEAAVTRIKEYRQANENEPSSEKNRQGQQSDWVCRSCNEINFSSFDLCWSCQGELKHT